MSPAILENELQSVTGQSSLSGFEGPEKLLEIWFKPPHQLTRSNDGAGLRGIDQASWQNMLNIVKCQILSVIQNDQVDAFLLR
jgi:S-adenosylmethionine decarboxylase